MTKVGEHITLDIIGDVGQEYEPSIFENVINKIAKSADVTILKISKYKFDPQGFTILSRKSYELSYFSRKRNYKF